MHWVVHRVLPKGQCKQFCHRIKHNGEYISTISLLKGSATSEKSNKRNNRSATVNIFLQYLFSRVAQRVKRAIRVNKRSTTVNIFLQYLFSRVAQRVKRAIRVNKRSTTVNIFLHYLFSRVAQRMKRAIRVNKRSTTVNIFYDKNNATRPDKEELVNVRIQINITHDHIPDQVS